MAVVGVEDCYTTIGGVVEDCECESTGGVTRAGEGSAAGFTASWDEARECGWGDGVDGGVGGVGEGHGVGWGGLEVVFEQGELG